MYYKYIFMYSIEVKLDEARKMELVEFMTT